MKNALALVAVVVVAAAGASTATASPARAGATFCQDAAVFGHGSNLLALPPATLKSDYGKFKTLATTMVPQAPSSIRTDLKSVFTFDLGLFSELSKVGWSFAKIPKSVLAQWAVAGPKLKPASDAVIGYIDAKCGLKLVKP